jgi:hypothetical protein
MTTLLWVRFLGLVGGFLGDMAEMSVACYLLSPQSNLCGLVGVFVVGPIGVVVGIVAGTYVGRGRTS